MRARAHTHIYVCIYSYVSVVFLHLAFVMFVHLSILFNKVILSQPPSRFDELPDDFDPSGKLPGSFDDGDPQTTNLYVGNLSPQVAFLIFGCSILCYSFTL